MSREVAHALAPAAATIAEGLVKAADRIERGLDDQNDSQFEIAKAINRMADALNRVAEALEVSK